MGGAWVGKVDLLQGTLDMLILKALARGAMHGYEVARWIQQTTDDALSVEEGSLYPALHRLERRGWVAAEWSLSDLNRKAKYYKLTRAGLKQLDAAASRWNSLVDAISKVMQTA
jgi:PadR family transcriptional regulator, regulatory protein PadR